MLSSRKKHKSEKAEPFYGHPVTSLITGNLVDLEEKILALLNAKKIEKDELSIQGKEYKKELLVTAGKLTKISSACFQSTEINNVKIYKNDFLVPNDYKNYLQVQGNLTKLVSDDISNQHDVKHAIFHLERWIYISKICFERNDYFTAGAIMYALFSVNDNLMNSVSDTAKSIFWYYQQLYMRQNKLHILQFRQSTIGQNVIPLLSTLANSLSNAEAIAEANAEEKIQDLSVDEFNALVKYELEAAVNGCKNIYIKMKERHKKSNMENGSLEEKIFFCLQNEIDFSFKGCQKESKKIVMNEIIDSIYENEDWFYCYAEQIHKLQEEFSRIDTNKFERNDKEIHDRINGILVQGDFSNAVKLKLISKILENNSNINKKLLKKCSEILNVLKNLSQLNLKRISLETKTGADSHKVKITSDKRSSNKTFNENFKSVAAKEIRIRSAPSVLKRSLTNVSSPHKSSVLNVTNIKAEKEPVEINVNLSNSNLGFFSNNQTKDSRPPKKVFRSHSHVPKEIMKPQTSYASSQLSGLLFIEDDRRASRIRKESFPNQSDLRAKIGSVL